MRQTARLPLSLRPVKKLAVDGGRVTVLELVLALLQPFCSARPSETNTRTFSSDGLSCKATHRTT